MLALALAAAAEVAAEDPAPPIGAGGTTSVTLAPARVRVLRSSPPQAAMLTAKSTLHTQQK